MIFETTIHRDIIYLWNQIYETNFNRKRNHLITKFDDSVDIRRRIFLNDNDIREQSERYCSDQELSISRTNEAHRYSNSFHQRKSDRKMHRLNLRVYWSNDSWRSDKIINQRQICSISRRSKNRISLDSTKRLRDNNLWKLNNESVFQWKLNQVRIWSHHFFLYNFRSLLNVDFAYKRWIKKKNFRL